tara:strand:+ start:5264 stop:6289 length:1026 start_codon:yes stop_codon:yes gene_type:complete
MKKEKIIIFKNDATGDLIHSREAIYNISISNPNKEIVLFLSISSINFSFLFNLKNITIKTLSNKFNIIEKFFLFSYIIKNNISEIFILTPKNFLFYLPVFFKRIKFYAICVNDRYNYKRPNKFLRKKLYKIVINDRSVNYKRPSIESLQNELIGNYHIQKYELNFPNIEYNHYIYKKDYIYFHLKQKRFERLNWNVEDLEKMLNVFLRYNNKVIITRDIETNQRNFDIKDKFNYYDFKADKFVNNSSKIILLDNAEGTNLYNIIRNASKIVAFHGMITSFAWVEKKRVLDLYDVEINNWDDYRKYRNSFYEFKPSYDGYDFIIPKKDINKTLNKMNFFFNK